MLTKSGQICFAFWNKEEGGYDIDDSIILKKHEIVGWRLLNDPPVASQDGANE